LVEDASQSELLISDYSGIVYDFLLLERPQVHFVFDLNDYLSRRALFTRHRDMHFALQVESLDELLDCLTSEAWRSPDLVEAARRERERCLPERTTDFAQRSVEAIDGLLQERGHGD
jgi:CDP-glycerol glycerophosphotransferase (TagB/SpsB family)